MMFPPTKNILRRVLTLSIAATRGGLVRFRILEIIGNKPENINEIASTLKMDYKTIEYHMRVLEKSGLVSSSKAKYANTYELSALMKANKDLLKEIGKDLGKSR